MSGWLRAALSDATYRVRRPAAGAGGLRIVMYHRVTDAHPGDRLCVPVARFADQMAWLRAQGYGTMRFADAVGMVRGHGSPPPKSLVITFDDGYADNFAAAAMMAQHGFRGMFFIPTGFLEHPPEAAHPDDRPMSWGQLRELLTAGHEIGAHAVSHRKLTLIDRASLPGEVRGCKETLERGLRQPVDYFCYPAGARNEAVTRAVIDAGYRGACTVEPGGNGRRTDPFALRRTEISAFDSVWDLEKKLAGAYDWLHRVAQLRHRCSGGDRRQPSNAMAVNGQ